MSVRETPGLQAEQRVAGPQPVGRTKRDKVQTRKQATFTARETELHVFRALLPLERNADTDVLVLYGPGGIGKSELLSQYERIAHEAGIPVARIDPQVQATIFDFLQTLYRQLRTQSVAFARFEQGLARHQAIEIRLLKENDLPPAVLQVFAKGSWHQDTQDSVAPKAPSIEESAVVTAQVYRLVGRVDGDFWMKPDEELTDLLVEDLNAYAVEKRIVLLLDTYEVMGAFDTWVRERLFAGLDLEAHALLVIAGRRPLIITDQTDQLPLEPEAWQDYAHLIQQVELTPFSPEEAQAYLQKLGVSREQVSNILAAYPEGHPLTLSLLATQAGQATLADLTEASTHWQVLHTLLERIIRHVSTSLRTTLEACAILRVFNEESLAAVLGQTEVRDAYDEVRQLEFVKERSGGIALHDLVREALNEEVRRQTPARYRTLQTRAAEYYEQALAQAAARDRERLGLERLYHRVCADEQAGMHLYQEQAEDLVRYGLVQQLRSLLADVARYDVRDENSRLWQQYYRGRLAHLDGNLAEAEEIYQSVAEHPQSIDPKLRAYALCDWGWMLKRRERIHRPGGADTAIHILNQCLNTAAPRDSKIATALVHIADVYIVLRDRDRALAYVREAKDYFQRIDDLFGYLEALRAEQSIYGRWGDFRSLIDLQNTFDTKLGMSMRSENPLYRFTSAIDYLVMGRYKECEERLSPVLLAAQERRDDGSRLYILRDLGLALALQGRTREGGAMLDEALQRARSLGEIGVLEVYVATSMMAWPVLRNGDARRAIELLQEAYGIVRDLGSVALDIASVLIGRAYEVQGDFIAAEHRYRLGSAENRANGRRYYDACCLTGLARVLQAREDYANLLDLLTEVESLAQPNEYNDCLASIRLSQGYLAWNGSLAQNSLRAEGALRYFEHALIYALRHNRFLLDEVLWGDGITTPLRPIIPHCLARGVEGLTMLRALRDWWQTRINDVGVSRPDTISPIPEGIALLEAERLAREREPGDGTPQQSVVERLTAALSESM